MLCSDIQIDNNVKYKYPTKLRLLKRYHEIKKKKGKKAIFFTKRKEVGIRITSEQL